MKKISLQTKLEDCSVPHRYIDVIEREAEDIRTVFDLVSLTRCEFLRIRFVGGRCLSIWQEFLEYYGLHLGMTVKEILQYDPDGILQYDPESGKIQYKLISSLNCNPESSIDREQKERYNPKTFKIWHNAGEEPELNKWFIAQIGDDAFDTFVMTKDLRIWSKCLNIKRWAYICDLLTKGGER